MLESRYQEYERLEQEKLLMQLLGATSEEEVQEMIRSDMLDFTTYMDDHLNSFFDNQIDAFANFNSIFGQFLDEYKTNLEKLRDVNESYVETKSADAYLNQNDGYLTTDVNKTVDIIKKQVEANLYDIVENDTKLLSGVNSKNKDANGYYDYAANMIDAATSGDITEAIYQAVLRDVKIDNDSQYSNYKNGKDNLYSYDKLAQALKDSGKFTDDAISKALNQYKTAQSNAQEVANAIATEGNAIQTETAQAAIQLSTFLPTQLTESQAQTLATEMENNAAIQGILTDKSNVLSDKIGENVTASGKITAAVEAVSTLLQQKFNMDKKTATSVAQSYVSSYSGGDGGNSNSSIISQMKANSAAWHNSDSTKQQALADANLALGTSLGWTRDSSGTWYDSSGKKAYADGIENGPVTYTGLAMLHGSASSPEYVLNNDQAYSLLRYMATSKPEFESKLDGNNSTVYDFGGIIMNEVNSAEEFFADLNKAMNSRYNITKNKK